VNGLTELLQAPPALLSVLVAAGLAWLVRDWKLALLSAASLLFVVSIDQWDNAMETLSLVLVATLIALVVGIPLGITAARWDRVSRGVRPAMDLMQTMPAFVWLVPVVTLFSIGVEAGLVATVIFAIPPGVRLTELGIRQVDKEVVEAGHAFGGTPRQILRGIQMPLAMPTVMAGVNQVIMLALSMAVIAGLVGGGGLGSEVTTSISRLDVGLGFEAGLSVVVLAIYLDRITSALGSGGPSGASVLGSRLRRSRGRAARTDQASEEAPTQPAGVS
jgi:glycine betaine/proline transport system permease protein